ncbi:MAG: hypothetical protein K0R94_511, partial [Burkholderiales bacterium]|nr:hypothetical protein [Burkholderiales bacterium]
MLKNTLKVTICAIALSGCGVFASVAAPELHTYQL